MAEKKEKTHWAGFLNGKLDWTYTEMGYTPSIYTLKKEAKARFEDVRKVKIVEVKEK